MEPRALCNCAWLASQQAEPKRFIKLREEGEAVGEREGGVLLLARRQLAGGMLPRHSLWLREAAGLRLAHSPMQECPPVPPSPFMPKWRAAVQPVKTFLATAKLHQLSSLRGGRPFDCRAPRSLATVQQGGGTSAAAVSSPLLGQSWHNLPRRAGLDQSRKEATPSCTALDSSMARQVQIKQALMEESRGGWPALEGSWTLLGGREGGGATADLEKEAPPSSPVQWQT